MIMDLIKIADFLDKNGRKKDADLIDYMIKKYAGDDIREFFKMGMYQDFVKEEVAGEEEQKEIRLVLKSLEAHLGEDINLDLEN